MWMLVVGLLIANALLGIELNYKNHCIEELESSRATLRKLCDEEKISMLNDIKDFTDLRRTYGMNTIRDYCNDHISEIAQKNRTRSYPWNDGI